MIILGLTGSIGMGKSTTAQLFEAEGVPVHDADRAVHQLYSGDAVAQIEAEFPGVVENGVVNREKLGSFVLGNPEQMKRLETIVHPLVREASKRFIEDNRNKGAKIIVLDIPLLFETGQQNKVDKIIVATAPADIQRQRVLERPQMTAEKYESILSRQMPDAEKRMRADFIIDTSLGLESARKAVQAIISSVS